MENNDIFVFANDIEGALIGLESFVEQRFSSLNSIKRSDLHALQGLVKAIQIMATKNSEDIEKMLDSEGDSID